MIKTLLKVAEQLDAAGFRREADQIDSMIRRIAGKAEKDPSAKPLGHWVEQGDTLTSMTERHGASGYTVMDNLAYNKKKDPNFDERKMKPGTFVYIYCDGSCD